MSDIIPGKINAKFASDTLLIFIILLLISPVPITGGISTFWLSPILIVISFAYLYKKQTLNKHVLFVAYLYLLLIVLSVDSFHLHRYYSLMYLLTIPILIGLAAVGSKKVNYYVLFIVLIIFLFLVSLNSDGLFIHYFSSDGRLAVLKYQKEVGYVYGINKFLAGVFVLCLLFALSDVGAKYKIALCCLYFLFVVFVASRSHFILSLLMLVLVFLDSINFSRLRVTEMIKILLLIFSLFSILYFVDLEVVTNRAYRLFFDFESSNRFFSFDIFFKCANSTQVFYGSDLLECTLTKLSDLDNTFMYVMGSAGFVGFVVFMAIMVWYVVLMYNSRVKVWWKAYVMLSFVILLSIDILIYRPIFFLPLFVYLFTRHSNGVVNCRVHNKPTVGFL